MSRRHLWPGAAVLIVTAVVAGAIALLAGSAEDGPPARTQVSVLDRGQAVLLGQRQVRLRVAGEPGSTMRVVSVVAPGDGGEGRSAEREVELSGRSRRVALPLSAEQQELLRGCAPMRLTVRVEAEDRTARAETAVMRQPPVCGRFFAPDSAWNAPVAGDAELDPGSDAITASLLGQVGEAYRRNFGPTINQREYSTAIYTVPRDQRRVRVVIDKDETWADGLKEALADGVPIPAAAKPAAGNDGHLVVWQPSTDTMWEFWKARKAGGRWHAEWGGRMTNASRNPGWFPAEGGVPTGATASSLPMVGGLITQAELRSGRIEHALALAIPRPLAGWWTAPAQRTDGWVREASAVPQGARFRLDPELDVEALQAPPLVKAMARAAQRYGIYVRDKAGTVAFYAETPRPGVEGAGVGGQLAQALKAFPWNRLELLDMELRTYNGSTGTPPRPAPPAEPPGAKLCRLPGLACP